jgi:biotin synthase
MENIMSIVSQLKEKILAGSLITKEEAMTLADVPLEELTAAADEIRARFCDNGFDVCTIINGKCGKCSEDCKYCAQSAHYNTDCQEVYGLLDTQTLLKDALDKEARGIRRYSVVTAGKKLTDEEVDQICESIREIKKHTNLEICVSFGLLNEAQYRRLKEAGASRAHCNLETSRAYFKQVCSTHTYDDKIETLLAAKRAGLSICSGGILGLGESIEDRIDMVLTIRELGVNSLPVNLLNPIAGTPFGTNPVLNHDEFTRMVAIFRFIIPDGNIRLAGGRGLLGDQGISCFKGGANATISGDMLTTAGMTIESDLALIDSLGYEMKLL